MSICSVAKKLILEIRYLFDKQILLFRKIDICSSVNTSVSQSPGKSEKNMFLEKKNRSFSKILSVAASVIFLLNNCIHVRTTSMQRS